MDEFVDYKDHIFGSYVVPFMCSDGINSIITGYTILGPFKVDAVGIQARLIGLFFLVLSFIFMYDVLIRIPNKIGEGKSKKILGLFFVSPFFITMICCVILNVLSELLPFGTFLFVIMLLVCFYYQMKFNLKLTEIYDN